MLHLDPGEKILLEVRKHWFVFLSHGAFLAALAVMPLLVVRVLIARVGLPEFGEDINALAGFAYSIWLLILWISFFVEWTNYYLDVWYVTTKRVIDVEQKGMFHREISNLRFDKVQDVTIEVRGILATFFGFGNVRVQTASENSRDFYMSHAANPEGIRKLIFEQHNKVSEQPLRISHE